MAASGWVLLVVVTLAIAGGVFLSASVLSRIDAITRTAEAIIEGDIGRRVPMRGVDDDIDRLAATLNRMLDQISSLLSALRQVSWHIAHDLRTPLGRLRQRLEEAQRTAVYPADYECAIGRAIGDTDQILQTFAALLRIAQIESGTRRAGFRRIDLSGLVTQMGRAMCPSPKTRTNSSTSWSLQYRSGRRPGVDLPVARQPCREFAAPHPERRTCWYNTRDKGWHTHLVGLR